MSIFSPKAIIFDWDNTLLDSWAIIHKATNEMQKTFGERLWTFEETKKYVAKSARDILPSIYGDKWQEAMKIYRESYYKHKDDYIKLMDHAEILVKKLKNAGTYLAIVSSKQGDTLRQEVAQFGLSDAFAKIIGSEDTPEDKPSIVPVKAALSGVKADPSEIWFVGDSEIDVECAHNYGCYSIFFNTRPMNDESIKPAHLQVASLEEIINLLGL